MNVNVRYINEKCRISRATDGSLGYDFRANIKEPITIKSGEVVKVPLGVCSDLGDRGLGLFMFSRSGLALKHGLMLMNSVGVIDSDYRGEICACIYNTGTVGDYTINPLDRICQGVFIKSADINITTVDRLDNTERGSGGFNSTGVK